MPTSMLYMPLKVPPRHDLVAPLAYWLDGEVQVGYQNEGMPDVDDSSPPADYVVPKPEFSSVACRKELLRLAALRNCLSEHLQDSHKAALQERGLEDCQEYHATLMEFEKRGFGGSMEGDFNEEGGTHGLALTWKGAFATLQEETHHSLVWDRACTLWNVAALQSFVAAEQLNGTSPPTTKDEFKTVISIYQQAASNLATLRQLVQSADYETVDVSHVMLSFWQKLLLAQGQTCIYRMANLGDTVVRQHSTLAYLIQAAAGLYNEALALTQEPRMQSELPKLSKMWGTHCKAQSLISQARALFHASMDHRQQQQHALEIARLRQCVDQLREGHSFVKSATAANNMSSEYQAPPELDSLIKLARDRLARAEQDNNSIYLEKIPPAEDLPEIRAQLLIKTDLPPPPPMMITQVPLFEWCPQ